MLPKLEKIVREMLNSGNDQYASDSTTKRSKSAMDVGKLSAGIVRTTMIANLNSDRTEAMGSRPGVARSARILTHIAQQVEPLQHAITKFRPDEKTADPQQNLLPPAD
jgi:hypothetical protein